MPKVKLLVSRAGIGFSEMPGKIIEVSDEVARRYIADRSAELVEGETLASSADALETAATDDEAETPEKAPVKKKRGRPPKTAS